MDSETSQLGVGTLVDHFVVERLVGRGGMGEVYAARDTKLDRRVALKLVHPKALGDRQAVERFLHEARVTARFSHPHIVQVYFVGEHEGRPYVALEYLEGDTLQTWMSGRKCSRRAALEIGLTIADALAEAHAHGVLHRDLKPENVIMAADGRLRLVDFGLAKNLAGEVSPERVLFETTRAVGTDPTEAPGFRTDGAVLMGTPAYMAPEQWTGEEVTGAVDVWALGLLLVELVSGEHPFATTTRAGNIYALAAQVCRPEPVPLPAGLEERAPALSELIRACLSKEAPARPGSAKVAARLRTLRESEAVDRGTREPVTTAPEQSLETGDTVALPTNEPRTGRTWLTAIGALVVVVVLAAAALLWRPATTPIRSPDPKLPRKDAPVATDWTTVWQPLPESSNPDALAAFRRARAAFRAARMEESMKLYQDAVRADPTLAAAHLRIARNATEHLREARRLSHKLSECDRLLLKAREELLAGGATKGAAGSSYAQASKQCATRPEVLLRATLARAAALGKLTLAQGIEALDRVLKLDPGFAWASSLKGQFEAYSGKFADALRTFRNGLAHDAGAVRILADRIMVLSHFGRCAEMEADARRMSRVAPASGAGYRALAAALAAQDRPRAAVEAALAQALPRGDFTNDAAGAWQRYASNSRLHRIRLRALHGELGGALADLEKWYRPRMNDVLRGVHSANVRLRIALLREMGRQQELLRVATDYLQRRDAWQEVPKIEDWAVYADARPQIWRVLHEAGRIRTETFNAKLDAWAEDWIRRSDRIKLTERGFLWAYGYARAAHDAATARAALAALPRLSPIPPFRPLTLAELDIGRVYLLAGKVDEAVRWLQVATRTCRALMFPVQHTQAFYWLGRAHEKKGATADACRAYATVIKRWGRAKPRSVTADDARVRRRRLSCSTRP